MTQTQKTNSTSKKTLASVVGIAAAAILFDIIPKHEGVVHKGYLDPIGIPTKCMGDTRDVIVGKIYTPAECLLSMESALINHAEPVLRCTPVLKDRPEILAAAVSFAYNFGPIAYCTSSIAQNFNRGDFATGCKRFNEGADGKPQWIYVKDKYDPVAKKWTYKSLPGLITRRAEERALCEKGLHHAD